MNWISGMVIEIGLDESPTVRQGSNFVRIKRENGYEVLIKGLTNDEAKTFAPFFMDQVHISLPCKGDNL